MNSETHPTGGNPDVSTIGQSAKDAAKKLHDENLIEFAHMKDEAAEIIQAAISADLTTLRATLDRVEAERDQYKKRVEELEAKSCHVQ
jgi:hypothetical protein